MFGICNEVDIVANNVNAINAACLARNANNWNLNQLIDKPDSNEVYLIFSKICGQIAAS